MPVAAHEQASQRDLTAPVRERITETLKARKDQLLRAAYITAARNDTVVVNYRRAAWSRPRRHAEPPPCRAKRR